MKCPNCEIEMKFIQNEVFLKNSVTHKGDGFLINDRQSSIHANIYVCSKCGLIQQYIPKDELKYLENL